MRSLSFRSLDMAASFESSGFVILRQAASAEVGPMREYILSRNEEYQTEFYYSILSHSPQVNKEIQTVLKPFFSSILENLLSDFTLMNESYLVKPSMMKDEMMLHQDWTYTDIERFTTGTVWIPLADTKVENGTLILLPGSHTLFQRYVSGSLPTLRVPSHSIPKHKLYFPQLQAGDVVIFNPAVFHGSTSNITSQHRIVVTATVFPHNAPFIYAHQLPDGSLVKVSLEEDSFFYQLENLSKGIIQEDSVSGLLNFAQREISTQEFLLAVSSLPKSI